MAIDTGTTLIGGPADEVKMFYANIPGALPASGSYQGYYSYPCNSSVSLTFKFGTRNYSMSSQDFNLGPFPSSATTSNSSSSTTNSISNPSMCLGAVFELTLAGASKDLISWVIGDSFLKNVLSIYRYTPPSVGFASLRSPPFNHTSTISITPNGTLFNPNQFHFIDFNQSFTNSSNLSLALFDQKDGGIGFRNDKDKKSVASLTRLGTMRGLYLLGVLGFLFGFGFGFDLI